MHDRLSSSVSRTHSSNISPPVSNSGVRSPQPTNASTNPLTITLVSHDPVIAEFIAPDQATFAEWVDGLNLLMPDGFIATKDTADYIQILTDIGVKVKMLDLTGEKLEIPAALPIPIVPPASVPFFYAE